MTEYSEVLRQQYQLRFEGSADYRNMVWKILCSEYFSRYIPLNSSVLDLGSGWGEFITNISASEKCAMDLNPAFSEHMSAEVRCIHQDCTKKWLLPSGSLDVIFTSNFFEHLDNKAGVESAISEAYRCLKVGGLIICMGPNVKYVSGAYWDFWDHKIPLTEISCAELLRMNNFSIERATPKFLPYSMSTGNKLPLSLVKLYLKLPVIWSFFGKQFLVIGRKNA